MPPVMQMLMFPLSLEHDANFAVFNMEAFAFPRESLNLDAVQLPVKMENEWRRENLLQYIKTASKKSQQRKKEKRFELFWFLI